jgi:hypothetical protein
MNTLYRLLIFLSILSGSYTPHAQAGKTGAIIGGTFAGAALGGMLAAAASGPACDPDYEECVTVGYGYPAYPVYYPGPAYYPGYGYPYAYGPGMTYSRRTYSNRRR